MRTAGYRGWLAPSPTGYLHLGHARTFWTAHLRAHAAQGKLIFRNDDLDQGRVRPEFVQAMFEDLRWLGLKWDEGPDVGGAFGPYEQSRRVDLYRQALDQLRVKGLLYPCSCSREDIHRALQAPHLGQEEPIYPGTCRHKSLDQSQTSRLNWRFRVPEGRSIAFTDEACGPQTFVAGKDFGDFVVWRHDGLPAYQLACVVDDHAMQINEVVRGMDLLVSTARQLLLYEALGYPTPEFFHCGLVTDENGIRLSKRHDGLSIRQLRGKGVKPEDIPGKFEEIRAFSRSRTGGSAGAS